jgi:hypothetical protein
MLQLIGAENGFFLSCSERREGRCCHSLCRIRPSTDLFKYNFVILLKSVGTSKFLENKERLEFSVTHQILVCAVMIVWRKHKH